MMALIGRLIVRLGGPHEPSHLRGFEITARTGGGAKCEGHAAGGQILDHHIRLDGINECTD